MFFDFLPITSDLYLNKTLICKNFQSFCFIKLIFFFLQAVVEQFSYGPFATASFFFFMTLLDGGSIEDAKLEVQNKFVPTWKVRIYT